MYYAIKSKHKRLIPESHHTHSQAPTLSMTVVSSMINYGLVQLT